MTGPADDDELLARLAATLRGAEEPPAEAAELARLTFGLRDLDAQLAELVADSAVDSAVDSAAGVPAGVRAATGTPRLLTFAADEAELELQVAPAGDGWSVVGQLVPPGPAVVRAEAAAGGVSPVEADADHLGRLALELPVGGSWRVVCTRGGRPLLATTWVLLR
jgi:hypothetical protein